MFQREDWTAFRTIDGLCRKAGVAQDELARTVVKELVDNSLDAAGDCTLDLEYGVAYVQDEGPGIDGDDQTIARLFSLNRPQQSSKFLRLPTRGCLGNGLRVVAGAVVASGGALHVSTRGRRLRIVTDPATGESLAERVGPYDGPGVRIEVSLGGLDGPLGLVPDDFVPGELAIYAARGDGKRYNGKTSPHWYDPESFHELLLSVQSDMTVKDFVGNLDGCFSEAGAICMGFGRRPARTLSRQEATTILQDAKACSREVNPKRLGSTGQDAFPGEYVQQASFAVFPNGLRIPVVVEAWATPDSERSDAEFLINGTPATVQAGAHFYPKDRTTIIFAPGFRREVKSGKTGMLIHVNIITPYMPVTSDGKAPSLGHFGQHLEDAIKKAVNRARRNAGSQNASADVKSVVLAHMGVEIVRVSDGRRYRFNWRQVFYRLRPIVKSMTDSDLNWDYFSQKLVAAWEEEHGEERQSYRDPRGTFYTPHAGDSFPLGTLAIEGYGRPAWRFNKVLFIEKEGFFEALKDDGWPERHDCALMTSKGQPTRAARDIIDLIGKTDEPVRVFCLHDCDAAGTIIWQSLQEATRARPERSIKIINLGLDVDEAIGLAADGVITEIEDIEPDGDLPVADYAEEHADWFQHHRVELNAFTTLDFIRWLDTKMAEHGGEKVIPPGDVLSESYEEKLRSNLTEKITEQILAEADLDGQVEAAMQAHAKKRPATVKRLHGKVKRSLVEDPQQPWDAIIAAMAVADATEGGQS